MEASSIEFTNEVSCVKPKEGGRGPTSIAKGVCHVVEFADVKVGAGEQDRGHFSRVRECEIQRSRSGGDGRCALDPGCSNGGS